MLSQLEINQQLKLSNTLHSSGSLLLSVWPVLLSASPSPLRLIVSHTLHHIKWFFDTNMHSATAQSLRECVKIERITMQ